MFCRKALFLAGLTLCVIAHSPGQVVTSAQDGFWNDPSTWESGIVPVSGNSSLVRVNHAVLLTSETDIGRLEISGSLEILQSGILDLVPPKGGGTLRVLEGGELIISGTLAGRDSVQFETNATNTSFEAGGRFVFRGSSRAFIPLALWNIESTLHINGFSGSGYVALAYSEGWRQSFGHVVYDCPLQPSFVDLNGHLRDVRGDLIIRNTNNQSLRLSTSQRPVIRIGRDFNVEGPSEVWVTTTSDSARLTIGRDFRYQSTSSGPSYLATRGRCHTEIGGALLLDASGPLRFCSGSADSTGVRRATVEVGGDFELLRGDLISPSPGKGTVIFHGTAPQNIVIAASALTGNFDWHIAAGSTVDFGTNVVRINTGNIFVKGHIRLGSTDAEGALQNGDGGNLRVNGLKRFYPGAFIEYNGLSRQFVGDGHPVDSNVDVSFNNTSGVQLLGDLTARNVDVLSGELDCNHYSLDAGGDLFVYEGAHLERAETIRLSGTQNAFLSLRGAQIPRLEISKSEPADVAVTSSVDIAESLVISSENTALNSNGNITLLSWADTPGGTARVASIPDGSRIVGDVTVQRYMSGEGRLYRYLASPITDAPVASLMDDFPVTGTFVDPSTGPGIVSTTPSLFYYDQAWTPFPVAGLASDNVLNPGLGYAAFVRGNAVPVVWDVTGELNQGRIQLPVTFYSQPEDPHQGWNLVGNPFASPVVWGGGAGWEMNGISSVMAVRDNGEGRFRYYDGEVGDLPGGRIAAGQAFWVRAIQPDALIAISESAKATDDAAFYREKGTVDFVRVSLTSLDGHDAAWIRIKNDASDRYDPGDAPKFQNDGLSLSILTSDSVSVAINAIDRADCGGYIPLLFSEGTSSARLQPGIYTLDLEANGLFNGTVIAIVDSYTDDAVASPHYEFRVTNDAISASPERLGLIVHTPVSPDVSLTMQPATCNNDAKIMINGVHQGSRYLARIDSILFYADHRGVITIPTDIINATTGTNVEVLRETVCGTTVVDHLTLTVLPDPAPPESADASRCGPGSLSLSARAGDDATIRWFEDPVLTRPIGDGDTLRTPVLDEGRTYFVATRDKHGCMSKPVEVRATVGDENPIFVRRLGHTFLAGDEDAQWFFEDDLVDEGMHFTPDHEGCFTVRIKNDPCYREKIVCDSNGDVYCYPSPFKDRLTLVMGTDVEVVDVTVFDSAGRRISVIKALQFSRILDTSLWPTGMLTLQIRSKNHRTETVRVVKCSN